MTPYMVGLNKKENNTIPVACGRCPSCIARRISGWSFRLMQEDKRSESSQFITLTYDTAYVPILPSGYMTLQKKDVQDFIKRLRFAQYGSRKSNIRYYACGEYGSENWRPHYHIILFNALPTLVQDAWARGQVHYGTVEEASVGYTLKYMSKPKRVPAHSNDDRLPEFSLMSKRLGANYMTPEMIDWHKQDLTSRMYCNLLDGKKISMPRYYKDKIYTNEERDLIAAKQREVILQSNIDLDQSLTKLHGDLVDDVKEAIKYQQFTKMYKDSYEGRRVV